MSTTSLNGCDPEILEYWLPLRNTLRGDLIAFQFAVAYKHNKALEDCASLWESHPQVMGRLVPRFESLFSQLYERVEILVESEKIRDFEWIKYMIHLDHDQNETFRPAMRFCYLAARHDITDLLLDRLEELCSCFITSLNEECVSGVEAQ